MSEWISVTDRLPDDGRFVLSCFIAHAGGKQRVVRLLHYNYELLMWLDDDSEDVRQYQWEVTHWMELPETPE